MNRFPAQVPQIHTPRYLVRRRTVLDALRRLSPGSFLEVGCGRGELLPWLGELGFTGVGLEISASVLPLARAAARPLAPAIAVVGSLDEVDDRVFDYLLSFEVLEHLEDDDMWLATWLRHLGPKGRFVCTVPAHMRLWSSADDAVGHVRRYERNELVGLLERAGLEVETLWSLGYPLVLLTRPLRHLVYTIKTRRWSQREQMDRTLDSAQDSTLETPPRLQVITRFVLEGMGFIFNQLGRPLRRTDHGDGYLVVARRQ